MAALYIYYIDHLTGRIKGGAECVKYSFSRDIDFKDKSTAVVTERPGIDNDDIVVINEGAKRILAGVCESISTGSAPYTLNILPIENIFDRTI